MLPVEIPAIGADFWAGNLYKWAYAPAGRGVLWVAPGWQKQMLSLVVSWAESEAIQGQLAKLGVETVVTPWTGGTLRLSAHVYNQPADYTRLGMAVRDCLSG